MTLLSTMSSLIGCGFLRYVNLLRLRLGFQKLWNTLKLLRLHLLERGSRESKIATESVNGLAILDGVKCGPFDPEVL